MQVDINSIARSDPEGSFRDTVATIDAHGARQWIYPKQPSGRYYRWRTVVAIVLLTLLFSGPFIRVNGHPFMLLNVLERKFILFGIAFWPQDFHLFVLAMLTFIVFIVLFTSLFGRLWCGWACPQTIFMEMVFRRIEFWIEGDSNAQKRLASAPASPRKALIKTVKYSLFFLVSFLIANIFLSYLIGSDELLELVWDGPSAHTGNFFALLIFTLVFFGVYTRFREQACIVACPYGRLQGVLLDKDSVVIAYDYKRGEPRAHLDKKQAHPMLQGDCIDCNQCVAVCPTGIDIRNGTQLECVNCTSCIDACNTIMDKVKRPRGLIRYTSEASIQEGHRFRITKRVGAYSIVLLILLSLLIGLLAVRSDVEATILRTPGMLYQKHEKNKISNLYNIKLVNKTFNNMSVSLTCSDPTAEVSWVGNGVHNLAAQDIGEGEFFLLLDRLVIRQSKTVVRLQIKSGDQLLDEVETNFIGPVTNTK